jgi:hypothetical protein
MRGTRELLIFSHGVEELTLPQVHVGAPTKDFAPLHHKDSSASPRMLLLHLRNGEHQTMYNFILGLPQSPRDLQGPPDHQDHLGAVKHQE